MVMAAGEGAAEQSRLAAERVARLKRQLDQAEQATKPWDAGAAGERLVADRLSQLIPHGWYVLHDVHWPGRPKASLDHVLVGPGGVVVIDAKNWTGEVRISSGVLWQGRYSRTQSVEGALAQCAAVASVLAPPLRRFARPLICMAAQPGLFGVTSSDVAVAGTDRIVDAILALPEALDQETVVGLYVQLGEHLTQEQGEGMSLDGAGRAPAVGGPGVGGPGVGGPGVGGPGRRMTVRGSREAKSRTVRPPAAERSEPADLRPWRQGLPELAPGPGASGTSAGSASRKFRAHDHAGTGIGRLFFLAGFVTFAVYVLPYWGR
jgi:hypothetical protein